MKPREKLKKRDERSERLGAKDVDACGRLRHVVLARAESRTGAGAHPSVSSGCPGDSHGGQGRGGVQGQ